MTRNRLATLLLGEGVVQHGDFILASGARSQIYLDVKMGLVQPYILQSTAREILRLCRGFDVVAGVAVGGVPLAVAVSLESMGTQYQPHGNIPYAIVRKDEKRHGLRGQVIGNVSGKRVLLVEDVTTTGNSALLGVRALREAGATVEEAITVVLREQRAVTTLYTAGVNLRWLLTMEDLLGEATS